MIYTTELISLHILDLLELLHASPSGEGSLQLVANGDEIAEFDLDDLCLVVKIVSGRELLCDGYDKMPQEQNVIPMKPR